MIKKLVSVVDRTALIFCIYLLSLLWCKFFIKNILIAIAIACFICFFITCLTMTIIDKKQNKKMLNKIELDKISHIKEFFVYNSLNRIKDVLQKKLKATFLDDKMFLIGEDVFYLVLENQINNDIIVNIIKDNAEIKSFNLVGGDFKPEVKIFCESVLNVKINLIDAKSLLINYSFDVEDVVNQIRFKQKTKHNLKSFLMLFVQEKNFKGYIISSIVIILSSLIIRQKFYYYVIATALIVLAFICKIFGYIKLVKK